MGLSVGIVGFPNAGKSTLFNALVKRQQAKVAEHPFTTVAPNTGTVDVPDENLEYLAEVVEKDFGKKPQKSFARLTVVDIAGLIKGAHQGEGLGNEFLGYIREVDVILHLLRAFADKNVSHPLGDINPVRDLEVVETELIMADFSLVEKHLKDEKLPQRKPILEKIYHHLKKGIPAAKINLSLKEKEVLGYFPLLSQKKKLIILNVSENQLSNTSRTLGGRSVLPICARLEEELLALDEDEKRDYLQSLGIAQSALEAVLVAAYHLLDLITFYTIAKGNKVSAWPVRANTTAREAVANVHTQLSQGFIKAEVIQSSQLIAIGSWKQAQKMGKTTFVGRDYLVKDTDVIEVRFRQK